MEQQLQQKIDEIMQLGYRELADGNLAGAFASWRQAWSLVAGLIRDGGYRTIEELDSDFRGRQSVANWANDYVQALLRPGKDLAPNWDTIVGLCRQYLAWSGKPDSLNNRNRRRLIGEGLFALGRPGDGDAAFAEFLAANPQWGWGWVIWAAQYLRPEQAPWHDLNRAEAILRRGLRAEGLDNRTLVVEQLRAVLRQLGRPIEASIIQ